MDDMVGDLLQLARWDETGGALPTRTDVDLVAGEASRRRGLGVTVDDSGVAAARVQGDRSALARLVRNLADNAARHARSTVGVSLSDGDDTALVVVDDDGPGLPVADRERVFERFTRLDEGRTRGAGGSGLGLALVRAVSSAHGGTCACSMPRSGAPASRSACPRPFARPHPSRLCEAFRHQTSIAVT
jgi:signal transduction histidine kinase